MGDDAASPVATTAYGFYSFYVAHFSFPYEGINLIYKLIRQLKTLQQAAGNLRPLGMLLNLYSLVNPVASYGECTRYFGSS